MDATIKVTPIDKANNKSISFHKIQTIKLFLCNVFINQHQKQDNEKEEQDNRQKKLVGQNLSGNAFYRHLFALYRKLPLRQES